MPSLGIATGGGAGCPSLPANRGLTKGRRQKVRKVCFALAAIDRSFWRRAASENQRGLNGATARLLYARVSFSRGHFPWAR